MRKPDQGQEDFKPYRQFSNVDPSWSGIAYRDLAKPLGLSEDNITEVSSTLTSVTTLGVGTSSPTTTLEIASQTSPQLKISYDLTHYATLGVDSAGILTITPTGTNETRISYLTQGSVLFSGANGKVEQDNSNFFWDDTTNQLLLGSGTAANPSYSFVSEVTNGIFRRASGALSFSPQGTARFEILQGTIPFFYGGSTTGIGWASGNIGTSVDVALMRDAAASLGLRNGTNAQTFSVYNTYTAGTPDYERLEMFWSANVAILRTGISGTGAARGFDIRYSGTSSAAMHVDTGLGVGIEFNKFTSATAPTVGAVSFGKSASRTALSGTALETLFSPSYSDGGSTSSTVSITSQWSPTINYTAASKTGKVYLQYLNPTLTSLPTGNNAGIAFSSAFTNASFPSMRWFNTADEVTDTEYFECGWHIAANVYGLRTKVGGTGTARALTVYYGNTTTAGVTVPASYGTGIDFGPSGSISGTGNAQIFRFGNGGSSANTSATVQGALFSFSPHPTSTSTMAFYGVNISPTINFAAGTPGAGYVYGLYLAPVNTALPTGVSAAIALSATASALNGIVWNNQTDEQTNYEQGRLFFSSNVLTLGSYKGGTGTLRGIQIGVTSNALGFLGATPVTQKTGGENVTNNVTNTASTDGTIPDITNGAVYATDYTNLRNALYQLARLVKQDHDALRAYGLLS